MATALRRNIARYDRARDNPDRRGHFYAAPVITPIPASSEMQIGGAAVIAVDNSNAPQCFIMRNFWGSDWCIKGYFTLPYACLADDNLAADFWTMRLIAN